MKKAIKKIMAWSLVFVCAATAGFAAIATNGFGLGDPTAQVEQTNHNKQLSFGGFFGNGITLKASAEETAAASTGTVRLTATVTPANAYVTGINWSVAFADPSSEWATGKTVTDYVSITPDDDNSQQATVNCLSAFGEQIIVTATCQDNEEVTAQCRLDYAKRFRNLSGNVSCTRTIAGTQTSTQTYSLSETKITEVDVTSGGKNQEYETTFNGSYTMSTGTIMEDVTETYTLEMSDGLRAAMEAQGLSVDYTTSTITSTMGIMFDNVFFNTYLGISSSSDNYELLTNAIGNNADEYDFAICYNVSTAHDSQKVMAKVKINAASMIAAEAVVLSLTNHVF